MSAEALVEVAVERLVPEGRALGRTPEGRVVLMRGALPGDRVGVPPARLTERTLRRPLRADEFTLLASSTQRVAPRCSVAEACGGCDWMALAAQGQDAARRELVADALRRTGGLATLPDLLPTVRGPADGYRRRIRLALEGESVGFRGAESHALVEPEKCWVAAPQVRAALQSLRAALAQHPGGGAPFSAVEARLGCDGSVSLYFLRTVGRRGKRERAAPDGEATRGLLEHLRAQFKLATSVEQARDPACWQRFEPTDDSWLLVPPGRFTQVNWGINRALVASVLQGAAQRGLGSFLDLYCGAGNFTLPLLQSGRVGLGIEGDSLAVFAATTAAQRQGHPAGAFRAQEVGRALAGLSAADWVLLDPPRAGLTFEPKRLLPLAHRALCLISCNPVTLARDLRRLVDLGYELESIQPFEMFPETHHVELLTWLRAPPARS